MNPYFNINDLKEGDFKVISTPDTKPSFNIRDLPIGSYDVLDSLNPQQNPNEFDPKTGLPTKETQQNNGRKIANFTGGGKIAAGLGEALTQNKSNNALDLAQKQSVVVENNILQKIKEKKARGEDVSHLYQTLADLNNTSTLEAYTREHTLNPENLSKKQVVGDAVQLGATAIPIGEASSLAEKGANKIIPKVITNPKTAEIASKIAGKTIAGFGTGYAFDVGNQLQDKNKTTDEAFKPGLGTVAGATLPLAGALIGELSKKIVGFTAGTGQEVLQRALDNPDSVGEAVKKYATNPETKTFLVEKAKSAIGDFVQSKQQEFGKAIDELPASEIISKEPAIEAFKKGLDKFGVILKDDTLDFANSNLTSADQRGVQEAFDKLNNWTDDTPKGLDRLRQTLGSFMDDFKIQGNTRANVVLGDAQRALKQHLTENLPGYSKALNDFSTKSKVTNDVLKELQLTGKAKETTQLANIMKVFKKDPSVRNKLVTILGQDETEKFLNEISGAILSDWLPANKLGNALRVLAEGGSLAAGFASGHVASAIPATLVGAAAMSPKIVGKVARNIGKVNKNLVKKVIIQKAANTGT